MSQKTPRKFKSWFRIKNVLINEKEWWVVQEAALALAHFSHSVD